MNINNANQNNSKFWSLTFRLFDLWIIYIQHKSWINFYYIKIPLLSLLLENRKYGFLLRFQIFGMKNFKTKKVIRAIIVISCLALSLFVGFLISINLVVDPIIYWLASTGGARAFISCIISWFCVSILFDLFYERYKFRKKLKRFNALRVPYPRTFKGRKWLFFRGRLGKYIKIVKRYKRTK